MDTGEGVEVGAIHMVGVAARWRLWGGNIIATSLLELSEYTRGHACIDMSTACVIIINICTHPSMCGSCGGVFYPLADPGWVQVPSREETSITRETSVGNSTTYKDGIQMLIVAPGA